MTKAIVKLYALIGVKRWNTDPAVYMDGNAISAELDAAASQDGSEEIELRVSSGGGLVSHGMVIQNAIARIAQTKPVTGFIDGIAASMGYMVLLPCTKIGAATNAMIMTHSVQGGANGSPAELIAEAEILTKYNSASAQYLMKRTGKTEEEVIAQYLGETRWFTAQEALDEGLIDYIEDFTAENVPDVANLSYTEYMQMLQPAEPSQSFIEKVYNKVIAMFPSGKKAEEQEVEQALIERLKWPERDFYSELIWTEKSTISACQSVIANGSDLAIRTEAQTMLDAALTRMTNMIKMLYGEAADVSQVADGIYQQHTEKLQKTVTVEVPPTAEKISEVINEVVTPLIAEKDTEIQQLTQQITNQTARIAELEAQPADKVKRATGGTDEFSHRQLDGEEKYMTETDRIKQQQEAARNK